MRESPRLYVSWIGMAVVFMGCVSSPSSPNLTEKVPVPSSAPLAAPLPPAPAEASSATFDGVVQHVAVDEPVLSAVRRASYAPPESLPAAANEPLDSVTGTVVQLDLSSVLASVDARHPVVGVARWRTQEALARLDAARVLWLPTLQAGLSYHRMDGNLQASDGQVLDINRSSLQAGLGAGAVGAGQTIQPGLVAQFHWADAAYQPRIARRQAWAEGHAATAALHDQLLAAGLAHQRLLAAEQRHALARDHAERIGQLAQLTAEFAAAGEGLQSDADRLATERQLAESTVRAAEEDVQAAAAALGAATSGTYGISLRCAEPVATPIELVSAEEARGELVSAGLQNRPELKEAQCLVAAACSALRREQVAPLLPSVLLGMTYGAFGGGLGDTIDQFHDRAEFNGLAMWQVRNLGFGEEAARRQRSAMLQRSRFEKLRRMDQVAQEILTAQGQITARGERIQLTERAIATAMDSYDRNLARIRQGNGLPIEVLQSAAALDAARGAYLDAVLAYNESQLSLYRALGWPLQI